MRAGRPSFVSRPETRFTTDMHDCHVLRIDPHKTTCTKKVSQLAKLTSLLVHRIALSLSSLTASLEPERAVPKAEAGGPHESSMALLRVVGNRVPRGGLFELRRADQGPAPFRRGRCRRWERRRELDRGGRGHRWDRRRL